MSELTECQCGQIVEARMVGASVSKVAKVFGVSGGTMSKTGRLEKLYLTNIRGYGNASSLTDTDEQCIGL